MSEGSRFRQRRWSILKDIHLGIVGQSGKTTDVCIEDQDYRIKIFKDNEGTINTDI